MKLKNKVIIVTGGTRGIGEEIVSTFLKEGAKVAICSKSKGSLEAFKESHDSANDKNLIIEPIDFNGKDAEPKITDFVQKVSKTWGGAIDVLVNNAGITGPNQLILNTPLTAWEETIRVNLTAAFLFTQSVLKIMLGHSNTCRIINISSVAGKRGGNYIASYSASKAAMIALTESTAREYGPAGVYANAICPGAIKTEMYDNGLKEMVENINTDLKGTENPLMTVEGLEGYVESMTPLSKKDDQQTPPSKKATTRDVAKCALFLASDDSSGMTGETFTVSCGAPWY